MSNQKTLTWSTGYANTIRTIGAGAHYALVVELRGLAVRMTASFFNMARIKVDSQCQVFNFLFMVFNFGSGENSTLT